MQGLRFHVAVIGAGAAGYMAAITAAEAGASVLLLEKSQQALAKVKISGGGRCNVTHDCPDPKTLAGHYPRGNKELLGAFHHFGQPDVVQWFQKRGVLLKSESDGRMFPITDDSQTIIHALQTAAFKSGVQVLTQAAVTGLTSVGDAWQVEWKTEKARVGSVILAMGGQPKGDSLTWLDHLQLDWVPPVPSLFTFNLPGALSLRELLGVSVPQAEVSLPALKNKHNSFTGPMLITHWGLSGPVVLKLSAWCAPELAAAGYETIVAVNWLGQSPSLAEEWCYKQKKLVGTKLVSNQWPEDLPKRLWQYLTERVGLAELQWAQLNKTQVQALVSIMTADLYDMRGKTTFKEEFVTAGGLGLKQIDFKTMQLKKHPGLYACGELLNIDGVTGGFNFQAAWTTGYLAGGAAAAHAHST